MNATQSLATEYKRSLQTSLRLCTLEGLVAIPLVGMTVPVNVVLAALFTKALNLPAASIGLITSLPFVCNFLQLAITPLLSRWFPSKNVSITFASLQALTWVGLAILLFFIPVNDSVTATRWLVIWFFLSSLFGAVAGVSWNAWMLEWVPQRLRGKYFGRRNRLIQISSLTFLLLAGWVLSRWSYALPAFQLVVILALVLRFFSLRWQTQMITRERKTSDQRSLNLWQQLRLVKGARSFLVFTLFGAIWSFGANCFGPFYPVFMFDVLSLSAFQVGLLFTLAALGGAISMPAWGQLLDRFGNKSVMIVSLLLWQLQNYLWCFIHPGNSHILYFMWIWGGISSAGFTLGLFTLQLKIIPPPARNLAIGLNLAVTSLVAAIAPVLGGATLTWARNRWPGADAAIFHLCFILQPTMALFAAYILRHVQEPSAYSLQHVVGAMRNVRTLSGVFGLSFMVDYIFYRKRE